MTTPATRVAAVMAGGAVGTVARAGMSEALPPQPGAWPWATFAVNLAGALILGWLLARLAVRGAADGHSRFLVGTGVCGALTTFSALQMEAFTLMRTGHVALGVAYPVVSVAAGVAVAAGGVALARTRTAS